MTKSGYIQVGEFFAKDKNKVYRLTKLLSKKRLNKMDVLQLYVIGKDFKKGLNKKTKKITLNNQKVLITPIRNSDPDTFKCFSLRWAADKNQVYHYTKPTKKIDPTSFEHLITFDPIFNDLAKDKNFVYNINVLRKVRNADAKSFKILNKYWAKDKNHIYCIPTQKWERKIDVNTFKVLSLETSDAEDKEYTYIAVKGVDWFYKGKVKRKKKKHTTNKI